MKNNGLTCLQSFRISLKNNNTTGSSNTHKQLGYFKRCLCLDTDQESPPNFTSNVKQV